MSRVLLIDDDAGTLLGYKYILRGAGYDVTTVALGEDGVSAARRDQFDAVLCDQQLPDISGIDVVRQIHECCPRSAVILVTAWGTPELIIEAKRAGAVTFAEKPLIGEELISVVHAALEIQARGLGSDPKPTGYAAQRWVDMVVRGVYVTDDPSSVLAWCKHIALTRSTLHKRCHAVGVSPKQSLDFVRLLRVAIHHAGEPWDLQCWLDVADDRTARALMRRAGFDPHCELVPSPESFLSRQRLIIRSDLIHSVRSRLSHLVSR